MDTVRFDLYPAEEMNLRKRTLLHLLSLNGSNPTVQVKPQAMQDPPATLGQKLAVVTVVTPVTMMVVIVMVTVVVATVGMVIMAVIVMGIEARGGVTDSCPRQLWCLWEVMILSLKGLLPRR